MWPFWHNSYDKRVFIYTMTQRFDRWIEHGNEDTINTGEDALKFCSKCFEVTLSENNSVFPYLTFLFHVCQFLFPRIVWNRIKCNYTIVHCFYNIKCLISNFTPLHLCKTRWIYITYRQGRFIYIVHFIHKGISKWCPKIKAKYSRCWYSAHYTVQFVKQSSLKKDTGLS